MKFINRGDDGSNPRLVEMRAIDFDVYRIPKFGKRSENETLRHSPGKN